MLLPTALLRLRLTQRLLLQTRTSKLMRLLLLLLQMRLLTVVKANFPPLSGPDRLQCGLM